MRAVVRCSWAVGDPLMEDYHDNEWGFALRDSRALWEKLMIDGFQAGLSWMIVLRKRQALREAFEGFDPARVAQFTEADVQRLLQNPGIIRSRSKIQSTIGNAHAYLAMVDRGIDFSDWVWSFTDGNTLVNPTDDIPAKTELSERISKELKDRGFKFVGPTIVYAWMQAVGLVDDHASTCFRRTQA